MNLPKLTNNYSWAFVHDFTTGPRRELTLFIQLHFAGTKNERPIVPVRFGGIVNFDVVRQFFEREKKSGELFDLLQAFDYDYRHKSKPGKLFFRFRVDRSETEIVIECSSITEGHPPESTSN